MKLEKPRRSAYASRPDYDRILQEFEASDSVDALDILIEKERAVIETFPEGWEHLILSEYDYRRKDLLNQQERSANHALTGADWQL